MFARLREQLIGDSDRSLRAVGCILRGGDMRHRTKQRRHRMVVRKVSEAARAVIEEGDIIRQHDVGKGFMLADFAGLQNFL